MSQQAYERTPSKKNNTYRFEFDFATKLQFEDDLSSTERSDIKEYYSGSKNKIRQNLDELLNDLED